jgi:hypothetical protein
MRPRLASSSLAPYCIGTMRWHAHEHHVATTSHPLSISPPHQRCTDKRPPRRLHARPRPLQHRCCALLRTRALPLSHHLPLSLLAQACIAPTLYAAIKEDPPIHLSVPPLLPPTGKPPRSRLASVFHHFVGAKPPHPTSLPIRRSQSFTRAQSCSPT